MRAMNLVMMAICLLVNACASAPATKRMPEGTQIFAEVAHVVERSDLIEGFNQGNDRSGPADDLMLACGLDAETVPLDQVFLLRNYYYVSNRVTQNIHSSLEWVTKKEDLYVSSGTIAIVELMAGRDGRLCPTITEVIATDDVTAGCKYDENELDSISKGFACINPIGPPGTASLYCPYLEKEGWEQTIVGPFGGFVWTKRTGPVAE